MKTTLVTAFLMLLAVAGYAQSSTPKPIQLPPIEKKSLDLKYLGKDSSSVLERIRNNDTDGRLLQKPSLSITKDSKANKPRRNSTMPTMQPDPKVQFPILAVKPDTGVHYHLQVKKPE